MGALYLYEIQVQCLGGFRDTKLCSSVVKKDYNLSVFWPATSSESCHHVPQLI